MKKWLILGGVVLAGISVMAIAAANLDAYLNENKDWLEEQAAAAVGRPVRFDRVSVGVWPGLGVDLSGLRIADDPRYSDGNFFEVEEIRVRVDLLPAVFGELGVSGITVRRPVLTVIQTSEGLNLDALGVVDESALDAADDAPKEPPPALAVLIAFLELSDGEIRYIDRRSDPPAEFRIERIEFNAQNVGLIEPIRFEFRAVFRDGDGSDQPAGIPFKIAASVQVGEEAIDITKGELSIAGDTLRYHGQVRLDSLDYDLQFNSEPIDLAGREALLPALSGLGLGGSVAVDIAVSGKSSSPGLPELKGTISLSDVEVRVPDQPPITGLSGSLELRDGGAFLAPSPFAIGETAAHVALRIDDLDEPVVKLNLKSRSGHFQGVDFDALDVDLTYASSSSVATLDRLMLAAYGGEVFATGSYDPSDPDAPVFQLDSRVTELRLEKLLAAWSAPASRLVEGKLGGELQLAGIATDWDSLKSSLRGTAVLSLEDGVLHDLNVGSDLLGKLSGVPGLQFRVPEHLAAQYPAVFGGAATNFQNMRGQLRVQDGRVLADNLQLVAGDYSVTASGSISLDADVDLRARFVASKALSQSLIGEVKALRYLRNTDDLVAIPFQLKGVVGEGLQVQPDMKYLAERVAPALIVDLLGRLSSKQQSSPGDPSAHESDEDQVDPAAAAAESLLRNLFR